METVEIIEVTPLPEEGNIQVYSIRREIEGETILSEKAHYELYPEARKDQFTAALAAGAKVAGILSAADYIAAAGWA